MSGAVVPMAYVARNTCGCVSGMIMDLPDNKRDVAKFCGAEIRAGLSIERVELARIQSKEITLRPCESGPCVRAKQRRPAKQEAML